MAQVNKKLWYHGEVHIVIKNMVQGTDTIIRCVPPCMAHFVDEVSSKMNFWLKNFNSVNFKVTTI